MTELERVTTFCLGYDEYQSVIYYTVYLNEGQLHVLLCKTQHNDSVVSTVKHYRSLERK